MDKKDKTKELASYYLTLYTKCIKSKSYEENINKRNKINCKQYYTELEKLLFPIEKYTGSKDIH
jgi:hypothetical protein